MAEIDNDMDELFKQAADNYKLKEGESDWDKIAGELSAQSMAPVTAQKGTEWRKLLPLMLLLLIGVSTCTWLTRHIIVNYKEELPTGAKEGGDKNDLRSADEGEKKQDAGATHGVVKETEEGKQSGDLSNGNNQKDTQDSAQHPPGVERQGGAAPGGKALASQSSVASEGAELTTVKERAVVNHRKSRRQVSLPLGDVAVRAKRGGKGTGKTAIATASASTDVTDVDKQSMAMPGLKPVLTDARREQPDSNRALQRKQATTQAVKDTTKAMASVVGDSNKQSAKQPTTPPKERGLLLGIATGPEWNQVKGQGVRKAGFDFGLIAGYRFSRRLSVETGVGLAKKYYWSTGKYFKAQGMDVVRLDGSSTIIEIPLKVKYDVPVQQKSSVFASAGVMSYLLTNEKNDYILLVNGAETSMTAIYPNASRYFASAIDISAGYERYFGRLTALRIEPYMQIPLRGIGVGTMQVMSAGVHVGFVRRFQKRRYSAQEHEYAHAPNKEAAL